MNKITKLYKDFFGLTEQTSTEKKHPVVPGLDKQDTVNLANYNKELEKTQKLMKGMTSEEIDLDEAELTNKITDYQGGVEMLFTDPAMAKQTMIDIITWAKKKGFDVITKKMYKTQAGSKAGYIYFRLGEDPYKESQRIQGYIAQSPGISKFRFKVKQ